MMVGMMGAPPPVSKVALASVSTATVDKEKKIEELMRQRFRAKCRFKAIVRMVMSNIFWLSEGVEAYEGDNVKMRVEQAIRSASKAKSEQLLNLNDKALLNKPAKERTEQEKKYLYRLIGGLKCFKRYPKIVKKKLAAVTYFKYYGPGRVIVKQHHDAHALYFIMSGEVVVSLTIYDELMQTNISVDVGQMGVGAMFGEVSLLHNIPRTATCTTLGHCEFLQLMKEDFKSVLQHSVQKQWDTIKLAMSAFTYFDGLDDVSRRECCIVSKMKSFKPKDIIYGDNVGVPNYVYFILSGRAQMIENLEIVVSNTCGRKEYTLVYEDEIVEEDSQARLEKKYFSKSHAAVKISSSSQPETNSNQTKASQLNTSETSDLNQTKPSCLNQSKTAGLDPTKTNDVNNEPGSSKRSDQRKLSICPEATVFEKSDSKEKRDDPETNEAKDRTPSFLLYPNDERRRSLRMSLNSRITHPDIKTFFMQVCEFLPGASFGFGENMKDRRIVAITQVDVLMMPIVWLLQRNINNIWTRIRHYLDKKIPTKKELFKEFVAQRKWCEYKEKLVEDIVKKSKRINYTTIHDVPYSIRMNECLDI